VSLGQAQSVADEVIQAVRHLHHKQEDLEHRRVYRSHTQRDGVLEQIQQRVQRGVGSVHQLVEQRAVRRRQFPPLCLCDRDALDGGCRLVQHGHGTPGTRLEQHGPQQRAKLGVEETRDAGNREKVAHQGNRKSRCSQQGQQSFRVLLSPTPHKPTTQIVQEHS